MKLSKKENKADSFYDIERLIKKYPDALYYMVCGERSNGKSFSALLHCLRDFVDNGRALAYIRRWETDIKGRRGDGIFSFLEHDSNGKNRIFEATRGKWDRIYRRSGVCYLARVEEDEKGNRNRIISDKPFAYLFALSQMEHDKSNDFPTVKNIVFDEFTTRGSYFPDEFVLFQNCLSTVIRMKLDCKIFMLGNTVDINCPYFREMGITHMKDMKMGTTDLYRYSNADTMVAVEYSSPLSESNKAKKKSAKYFAFDNPKLKMITGGTWEMDFYPHCPYKYTPKDIVFNYYIICDSYVLQSDIVCVDGRLFTYIHMKSGEVKKPDTDIVFSQIPDPRPNWYTRLTGVDKISRKICSFFVSDNVFYQDNQVGEDVRAFIMSSKTMKVR